MLRLILAPLFAVLFLAGASTVAHAGDDYIVPIGVGGKVYTLTVTVETSGISVVAGSKTITVGKVIAVQPVDVNASAAAELSLDERKAQAVTIEYDNLFRNNEEHIGKTVRYVGEVVQVQEGECLLCEDPGYILRVAVTRGDFGLWDDPIWVDYPGDQRFLEDDIVTVWGTVEGLQKYQAVLGNQVTIPQIKAFDIQLGEVANPRPSTGGAPTANRNANLRGGPGTGFAVVGSVKEGDVLELTARNPAGDWLQLAGGEWVAAFLVDSAPGDLPVAEELPAAPAPTPETAQPEAPAASVESTTAAAAESTPIPAAEPAAQTQTSDASSSIVPIGQDIEAGGWRFKVSEVHKRKAVYFYDDAHVAMGHFLVVVIEATNLQSGTDYFDRSIDPWVTDEPGNVFSISGTGSGYAQWQYAGASSIYTNVDPGNFVRIAFAVDLPDDTGRVLLSTDVGKWIDLGNFAQLKTEDN